MPIVYRLLIAGMRDPFTSWGISTVLSGHFETHKKTHSTNCAFLVLTERMSYEMDLYKIALARFYDVKRSLLVDEVIPDYMLEMMNKVDQL